MAREPPPTFKHLPFVGTRPGPSQPGLAESATPVRTGEDHRANTTGPKLALERYTIDEIERYGKGTIAVSVAAFISSYLWTLIFLGRRVTNFDLSPFSFLRATIQICLACFVCIFLRHLYDSISNAVWQSASPVQNTVPATSSWLLTVAFLIG